MSIKFSVVDVKNYWPLAVDDSNEELRLEEYHVANKDLEVFLEDLLVLQPDREVEFVIDLVPGVAPLSKAPYRIAPSELAKFKEQLQLVLAIGLKFCIL